MPEGFPLWQQSASVQAGLGYKDNVTLSSFDPQGSAFAAASVEAMLLRLLWNNWQLSLLAMASDTLLLTQEMASGLPREYYRGRLLP